MITKIFQTPAQEQPCFLSAHQLEHPEDVIREHFTRYTLAEHRNLTWTILTAAISSDINQCYDATDVGDWVVYLRELDQLLEAVWLIQDK